RKAYTDAGQALMAEKPETFDPKALGKVGMAAVKELVMNRMKVCGCDGKAAGIEA
ncbi:MAG: tagatose-bisphosphate aldolase subunit KbaY, partial [Lachnospiraceae bacterium]|nr:tagatose-bisphosphate aldolase subunit KbaY [Lachnospiraceae bacterium]